MSAIDNLLRPEKHTILDQKGNSHVYYIGHIPYASGGREVGTQYMTTGAPKIGNYKVNQELAWIIYKYVVFVDAEGNEFALDTQIMIDNHVPDFMVGVSIEAASLEKLLGFSVIGKLHEYRTVWMAELPKLTTKILTLLKQSLQESDKQA